MSDKLDQQTDRNIELDALNLEYERVAKQIRDKESEIEFLTKPSITLEQYETIKDCVNECIEEVRWDADNFEIRLSLDYDNTIEIDDIDFNCKEELSDDILRHITNVFAIDDTEKLDDEIEYAKKAEQSEQEEIEKLKLESE